MNEPQTSSPRRRLQELLAIPDRLRTEAQWDELHELEISLAPGNRADVAPPRSYTTTPSAAPPRPRPSEGGGEVKKTFRKRHKKPPPKPSTP